VFEVIDSGEREREEKRRGEEEALSGLDDERKKHVD
jgi:hypothetical protein